MFGRKIIGQKLLQQFDLLREHVNRIGFGAGLQCGRGARIGAGRAPQPQINPPGIERLQHFETFRNLERAVMRQHDAACAHTDARGFARDLADQNFRGRSREAGGVVMFRHPIAVIAKALAGFGQRDTFGQRLCGAAAIADRGLIKYA